MEPFYGPPYDFRPTPTATLWLNYYTNPFIDSYEKIELGQWLDGLPPTYGEWWYQYAERVGLETPGATEQPGTSEDTLWNDIMSEFMKLRTILLVGVVVWGLTQIPSSRKK